MIRGFEHWWTELYPDTLDGKTVAKAAWIMAYNQGHRDGYKECSDDFDNNEDGWDIGL